MKTQTKTQKILTYLTDRMKATDIKIKASGDVTYILGGVLYTVGLGHLFTVLDLK